MDPKVSDRLAGAHPQMLRVGLRSEAKADRKPLADLRPAIGRLVNRALQLMNLTKQEAAYEMDYADAGTISRWCAGTERPAFDKLFTLDGFARAYVLAIAEQDPHLEAYTTIRMVRSAR